MLVYPHIDPVAVHLGPLAVRWYGLTYLVAFGLFYWLGHLRLRHQPFIHMREWAWRDVEDMLFYGVLGVIVGGRLGYALFYEPGDYAAHPLKIFFVWDGGMSFHGGMLGVFAAGLWWARTRRRPWLQVMDFVAPCVPVGLASGRIGNFINGELWGRLADPSLPWAMVFPDGGPLPRHPSQIYEFLLEGLLLFALLWLYARGPRKTGQVSGAFLLGYGVLRFTAEFFRQPDAFLGLQALGLSRGQWLCVPMILIGALLWLWASRRAAAADGGER